MKPQGYKKITHCRLCGSDKLDDLFSLGNLYVSTFVDNLNQESLKAPLELTYCDNCTLLQLRHTVPMDAMYKHYNYKSGINEKIVNDLKEIVETGIEMANLKEGDVVLSIGANDGTECSFVPKKFISVGCEPADNLQEELRKRADKVIHGFWSFDAYEKL